MEKWTKTLISDTSEHFVFPYPVTVGERVEVTLLADADAPIRWVTLRTIENGIDRHRRMHMSVDELRRSRFSVSFSLEQPVLHYHFVLEDDNSQSWFYTRDGVTSVFPTEINDFCLDSNHDAPSWVAGSVFYQIFPDRFANGRPEIGVVDGEISRDGFTSRVMSWDEKPLPWSDGGSLDFFNGDLYGIIDRLDYLADLGVSALYLNPIFTAKTNHRYDCLDYFSVDPHLGGDRALIALSDACHARGMKLILDVSINHIGIEHPWAEGLTVEATGNRVPVVLRDKAGHAVNWMGVPELLKLDYRVPELCDRIYRASGSLIQRYLEAPFFIDGWRFDVASETGRHGEIQDGHQIWREIRDVIKRISRQAYIVGELWQDPIEYLGGDEWDSAMNYFGCERPARLWIGERDRFTLDPQREGVARRPISGAELVRLLRQHFFRLPGKLIPAQFNLLDSHDVSRLYPIGLAGFERYAATVALMFFLPGTACIYYGDEVGVDGNLEGDHGKRFPMIWDKRSQDTRLLRLYRELAWAKRSEPSLSTGALVFLSAGEHEAAIARVIPGEALVLVMNRAQSTRTIQIPCGPLFGSRALQLALLEAEEYELPCDGDTFTVELPALQSRVVRLRQMPDA
jgi:alpha-glucosidase